MEDNGWYGMLTKERFGSDLIEATIRSGDDEEAERLLGNFEELAESAGRVWARAAAARCRALLIKDARAEECFQRALTLHHQTTTAFEEARTQLSYGEWLREAGRACDARRALNAARGTFERLGAAPWSQRADLELEAAGVTVAPAATSWSSALTPQELQVALAVAEGATNKEAAAMLFVSPKTIEFHLSNAYRKLKVRSRTQLARLLSDAGHDSSVP
jgi:DNA-binding NarL/FixJ family response regulator